ncbi:hypothetical protein F5Y17DRAFT_93024 [Xylariaceae sp. FL0594]|nr:hypothetical protein F5Y17DRAFT_93024 [Xylariaceae sp. FL0594]
MPRSTRRSQETRGLGLQCPFSKCLPQLFDRYPTGPCVVTRFADFREMSDHIWKYHSYLLGCQACDYRFKAGKRTQMNRHELADLKRKHAEKKHQPGSTTSRTADPRETMTAEEDELFKNFKAEDGTSEATMVDNYQRLCRLLFGANVIVPDPKWNYFIPEFIISPLSAENGRRNLEYVRSRRSQECNDSSSNEPELGEPESDEPESATEVIVSGDAGGVGGPGGGSPEWAAAPTAASSVDYTDQFISDHAFDMGLPLGGFSWPPEDGYDPLSLDVPQQGTHQEPVIPMVSGPALASQPDSGFYTASNEEVFKADGNQGCFMGPQWPAPVPAQQLPPNLTIGHVGSSFQGVGSEDWRMTDTMESELEDLSYGIPDGSSGQP